MRRAAVLLLALAACTSPQPPASTPASSPENSLLPGTIGVLVHNGPEGPVVAAVRENVQGVREGDVVLRYNGAHVKTAREFNRLVADSIPGDVARLELARSGARRVLDLPVRQLDTMPRG